MEGGAALIDAREALSGLRRRYAKLIYSKNVSPGFERVRPDLSVYL